MLCISLNSEFYNNSKSVGFSKIRPRNLEKIRFEEFLELVIEVNRENRKYKHTPLIWAPLESSYLAEQYGTKISKIRPRNPAKSQNQEILELVIEVNGKIVNTNTISLIWIPLELSYLAEQYDTKLSKISPRNPEKIQNQGILEHII